MKIITRRIGYLLLLYWVRFVTSVTEASIHSQNTIEEFLRQFTSLFNQSSLKFSAPLSRDKDLYTDYLNTINQQFTNYQDTSNGQQSFGQFLAPLGQQRPPRPPYFISEGNYPISGDPGAVYSLRPPKLGQQPRPTGNLPVRPAVLPGYQTTFGSYPQTSLLTALASIAKYDDLRCVPRLLCEVTSGTVTKSSKYKQDKSPIPFLTKDAFVTLLTVLNFVDDSPILLFARAAFLGYSTKGDTKACLTAYPTCPKDPDQLVNYLNNHNGGFFRFFNQQLQQQPQYAPQYQQSLMKHDNSKHRKSRKNDNSDERSKKSATYPGKYGFTSRIINDPLDLESVDDYLGKIANTNQPIRNRKSKLVFSPTEHRPNDLANHGSNDYRLLFPTRSSKKISFPEKSEKFLSDLMVFPDRTGTGNLILSDDTNGKYRIVYANENSNRRKSKIKFLSDNEKQEIKMQFPQAKQKHYSAI